MHLQTVAGVQLGKNLVVKAERFRDDYDQQPVDVDGGIVSVNGTF
jgi:hypothetical protein